MEINIKKTDARAKVAYVGNTVTIMPLDSKNGYLITGVTFDIPNNWHGKTNAYPSVVRKVDDRTFMYMHPLGKIEITLCRDDPISIED